MVLPQISGGGDSLQIWIMAANTLNKQLQMANKGWFSRLGVGQGANNSSPLKNQLVTKCYTGPWICMDS
jgi:hypothetical protein